jgi:hypothetical protein
MYFSPDAAATTGFSLGVPSLRAASTFGSSWPSEEAAAFGASAGAGALGASAVAAGSAGAVAVGVSLALQPLSSTAAASAITSRHHRD